MPGWPWRFSATRLRWPSDGTAGLGAVAIASREVTGPAGQALGPAGRLMGPSGQALGALLPGLQNQLIGFQ